MNADLKVNSASVAELQRAMDRLSRQAEGRLARNATMAAARLVAEFARQVVPVRTGRLKASIKARRPKNRRNAKPVTAYANAAARYAFIVEHGSAHSAAKPFLRPAVDEHTVEIRAKIEENLAKGLARELAKLPPESPLTSGVG
jgi:HK97 gp10 family phage protein